MSKNKASVSDHLFNVGLLVVLIYVVTLPGGQLRTRLGAWRAQAHLSDLAEDNWGTLAVTSARMGSGPARAPVIIEFGDYECPFCRRSHPHLKALVESDLEVTIGFRHYPLSAIHPKADGAARAAICAESQGRFVGMHSLLFESSEWQDTGDWRSLAEEAGVPDLTGFVRCLSGEAVEKRLEEDMRLAEALEVTGTPVFFYQFGAHVGYLDADQLVDLLESRR